MNVSNRRRIKSLGLRGVRGGWCLPPRRARTGYFRQINGNPTPVRHLHNIHLHSTLRTLLWRNTSDAWSNQNAVLYLIYTLTHDIMFTHVLYCMYVYMCTSSSTPRENYGIAFVFTLSYLSLYVYYYTYTYNIVPICFLSLLLLLLCT